MNMRDSATDSLWFEMSFIEYRPEALEPSATPPRPGIFPDVEDPVLHAERRGTH